MPPRGAKCSCKQEYMYDLENINKQILVELLLKQCKLVSHKTMHDQPSNKMPHFGKHAAFNKQQIGPVKHTSISTGMAWAKPHRRKIVNNNDGMPILPSNLTTTFHAVSAECPSVYRQGRLLRQHHSKTDRASTCVNCQILGRFATM